MVTTADENKQLVLSQYEAVKAKDMKAFMSRCSDDVVLLEANSLPMAGVYRGAAAVEELMTGLIESFDTSMMHPVRLIADDEYVTAMLVFHTGPPADYEITITEWWQIRDGKVAEIRPFYWDTEELNKVLDGAI